jgi:hypothetical protein
VLWDAAKSKLNRYQVSEINKDRGRIANEIKYKLIALARYTDAEQEELIAASSFKRHEATLHYNGTFSCNFHESKGGEHVRIMLTQIDSNLLKREFRIIMSIACKDRDGEYDIMKIVNGNSLRASYFDFPLSVNFMMNDGDRIAVILEDVKSDSAFTRVIHFAADYVTGG